MSPIKKTIFGGFFLITGFIVILFFLMRGCLSKYDERSAIARSLYFEKDTQAVIFSIVKFDKTTSYSRDGGVIQKTATTEYSVQSNNAKTGAKINEQKIKDAHDIKYFPIEILGASNGQAWLFLGELLAIDPFTLKAAADKQILEEKNPALKGKFPAERIYYSFNSNDSQIYFTATDGTKWQLNTQSFIAIPHEYSNEINSLKSLRLQLEKEEKKNKSAIDSLYKKYADSDVKLYSAGKMTYKEYSRLSSEHFKHRDTLYKQRDSLYKIKSKLEKQNNGLRELQDKIESLKQTGLSYNSIGASQDTLKRKWYGLYTKEEFENLYNHFRYNPAYDETARRQFFITDYTINKYDDAILNKDAANMPSPSSYFLDGNFLLDKKTGVPIHLSNGENFLVIYKDKIGNEGNIQLSMMDVNGTIQWTFNSQLHQWLDWICTGKQLFIFGVNNKEVSSGEGNVLWCIDLSTGKGPLYNFFTDALQP